MKSKALTFCSALVLISALPADQKMPLDFTAEDGWEVEYKNEGAPFFVFSQPKNEEVIFFFSRWPAPGGPDQIQRQLGKIADGLLESAKQDEEIRFANPRYSIEDIDGQEFSGKAALFEMEDGSLTAILMISCGEGIWNGQYHGPKDLYPEARAILQSMKKANKAE